MLAHVPTMTVMLGHWSHVSPFISAATEIDVSQAPHPSSATHNTDPALHQNQERFTSTTNTMFSGTQIGSQKVLHLYNCISSSLKGKKNKNLIASCWHRLPKATSYGYFSVGSSYSINNNSLSQDARTVMTNPASQEHSQRHMKHIAITPKNCTCQHGFYRHLIRLEKNGLNQTSVIVAHAWWW